jgi:hypothetical protein
VDLPDPSIPSTTINLPLYRLGSMPEGGTAAGCLL